jgi:hypothetical protein
LYLWCVLCPMLPVSGILGGPFQFSVWLLFLYLWCVLCPMLPVSGMPETGNIGHKTHSKYKNNNHTENWKGPPRMPETGNIGHKTHNKYKNNTENWKGPPRIVVFVFVMCLVSYVACLWHSWWSLSVFCVVFVFVMCLVPYVACLDTRHITNTKTTTTQKTAWDHQECQRQVT